MLRNSDTDCTVKSKSSIVSDCDSGFHEPGVLSVPLVRTYVHCDAKGNRHTSTSTDVISVKKRPSKSCPSSRTQSTFSLDNSISESVCGSVKNSEGSITPKRVSVSSLSTNGDQNSPIRERSSSATTLEEEEDDDTFTRETKHETDKNQKVRGYTRHTITGRTFVPTIREANVSKVTHFTETTTKKRRPKPRSKSADSNKRRGSRSLFSPAYSKVLSDEEMAKRREWASVIKQDCILEEEYYKVPYEECNREVILGRFSRSQPSLNFLRKSRKKVSFSEDTNDNERTDRQSSNKMTQSIPKKATNIDTVPTDDGLVSSQNKKTLWPPPNPEMGSDVTSVSSSGENSSPNLQSLIELIKEIKKEPEIQTPNIQKNTSETNQSEASNESVSVKDSCRVDATLEKKHLSTSSENGLSLLPNINGPSSEAEVKEGQTELPGDATPETNNSNIKLDHRTESTWENCKFNSELDGSSTDVLPSQLTAENCKFNCELEGSSTDVLPSQSTAENCKFNSNLEGSSTDVLPSQSTVENCKFNSELERSSTDVRPSQSTVENCKFNSNLEGSSTDVLPSRSTDENCKINSELERSSTDILPSQSTVENCKFNSELEGSSTDVLPSQSTVENCKFNSELEGSSTNVLPSQSTAENTTSAMNLENSQNGSPISKLKTDDSISDLKESNADPDKISGNCISTSELSDAKENSISLPHGPAAKSFHSNSDQEKTVGKDETALCTPLNISSSKDSSSCDSSTCTNNSSNLESHLPEDPQSCLPSSENSVEPSSILENMSQDKSSSQTEAYYCTDKLHLEEECCFSESGSMIQSTPYSCDSSVSSQDELLQEHNERHVSGETCINTPNANKITNSTNEKYENINLEHSTLEQLSNLHSKNENHCNVPLQHTKHNENRQYSNTNSKLRGESGQYYSKTHPDTQILNNNDSYKVENPTFQSSTTKSYSPPHLTSPTQLVSPALVGTVDADTLVSPALVGTANADIKQMEDLCNRHNDDNNNNSSKTKIITSNGKPPRAPKPRPRTKLFKQNLNQTGPTVNVRPNENIHNNLIYNNSSDLNVKGSKEQQMGNEAKIHKALRERIAHKKRAASQKQMKSRSPGQMNKNSKTPLVKNDIVDIFMRQNANFTDHRIELSTCVNTLHPNVSITRMLVPFSAIRDQWEWAKHFWPLPGMIDNMSKLPETNLNLAAMKKRQVESPSTPEEERLPTTGNQLFYKENFTTKENVSSPTPSCCSSSSGSSTSGCFSASCSPSPLPTNTLRVFPLPTPL